MATRHPDHFLARLPEGTIAQVTALLGEKEPFSQFVRLAVQNEIARRTSPKPVDQERVVQRTERPSSKRDVAGSNPAALAKPRLGRLDKSSIGKRQDGGKKAVRGK